MEQLDKTSIHFKRMIGQYRAVGIEFREKPDDYIVVQQMRIDPNGWMLTQRELVERARTVYPDKKYKILPVTYALELGDITAEWVCEQMRAYGLRPKDLVRQLGITQSEVSLFTTGKRAMTRAIRSMFYYYFLSYQLNRDLRKPPITAEELNKALELVRGAQPETLEQVEPTEGED